MCITVALLLACYSPNAPGAQPTFLGPFIPAPSTAAEGPCSRHPQQPGLPPQPTEPNPAGAAETSMPASAAEACGCGQSPGCTEGSGCRAAGCKQAGEDQGGAAPERCRGVPSLCGLHVSKADVRQRLAYVSAAYPAARPTRSSLKQVFNFFQQQSPSALPEEPATDAV